MKKKGYPYTIKHWVMEVLKNESPLKLNIPQIHLQLKEDFKIKTSRQSVRKAILRLLKRRVIEKIDDYGSYYFGLKRKLNKK